MKRRSVKKSVSFQAPVPNPNEELKTSRLELPGEVKSIFALPFHLPLVLYSLFRSGLTDNPYQSMVKGLVNLIVLQAIYGFWLARTERSSFNGRGKTLSDKDGSIGILILSSIIVSIILANVMFVVLILFGAPMYGFLKETYLLACHLSIIVFQPLLIIFRFDFIQFGKIFEHQNLYQIIFRNQTLCACLIALLGAWIGVIPIPLDWDRPWQSWPITILSGGYIGAFVGSTLAFIL